MVARLKLKRIDGIGVQVATLVLRSGHLCMREGMYLLDTHKPAFFLLVIHGNSFGSHLYLPCGEGDDSFKFLPYQLSMVG